MHDGICDKFKCNDIFESLFSLIDKKLMEKSQVNVAIEGGSGVGKSHLAALIQKKYDCNVFHMDDFFLQPYQRTEARFLEAGGNVDYERFKLEVVDNLSLSKEFEYQVYDCSQGKLTSFIKVKPKRLNIIEGVYSMHPLWYYKLDLKVFLKADETIRLKRILDRNGQYMLIRFQKEWIPLENKYFDAFKIEDRCDIVINTSHL